MTVAANERKTSASATERTTMKRVVVDHYGGPDVLRVVEENIPRAGPGEVRVRALAAGVSITDAQLRAGTYLGVPQPPFAPGYELVGVVEELGAGCSMLRVGDRVAALTVWGAYAEHVCVLEEDAVEVPEDLDPAEVVSLVLPYMTAYQLLHRTAKVKSGETVLVHGAAGRVGTAVLELGALAGLGLYGTASASDRAAVERLGAVAIDYRKEDFLARVRELPGKGVDVVLDGIGGAVSLRSFRALRPGGRLVVYGHHAMLARGRTSWRGWMGWYAATAGVALWGLLSPRRRMSAYKIQKLHEGRQVIPRGARHPLPVGGGPRDPECYREDFLALLELLREGKIHPVVAERLPLTEARRAHELLGRTAATGKIVLLP
jgi:NADPH:quinone reductase-like Zn-dependent oxidoreductase